MKSSINKVYQKLIYSVVIVFIIFVLTVNILIYWIDFSTAMSIVFGGFMVMFVPGFFLSIAVYPKFKNKGKKKKRFLSIDKRLALTPMLSIALITFLSVVFRRLEIAIFSEKIFFIYITLICFGCILAGGARYYFNNKI
jgi:uncharacterized membrane protein